MREFFLQIIYLSQIFSVIYPVPKNIHYWSGPHLLIDLDILNLVWSWGLMTELGDLLNAICLNDSLAIQNHFSFSVSQTTLSVSDEWLERKNIRE